MVLLFSSTYRLAVGHFFTKGLPCDQLHDLAMKVIKSIEKAGFAVTSLIGDNHVFNSKCFSLLSGGTTRPVVRWDILIIKTFLDCSTFLVTFAFFTIQNGFAAIHMIKIANFFWHLTRATSLKMCTRSCKPATGTFSTIATSSAQSMRGGCSSFRKNWETR